MARTPTAPENVTKTGPQLSSISASNFVDASGTHLVPGDPAPTILRAWNSQQHESSAVFNHESLPVHQFSGYSKIPRQIRIILCLPTHRARVSLSLHVGWYIPIESPPNPYFEFAGLLATARSTKPRTRQIFFEYFPSLPCSIITLFSMVTFEGIQSEKPGNGENDLYIRHVQTCVLNMGLCSKLASLLSKGTEVHCSLLSCKRLFSVVGSQNFLT
ncbi:hypothetical protein VTK73DRAFT_1200 [Phialemonium thermophilum]|uniref:Uncharacterized protein n=1 Tax=Phialemonium thermophilum TaxID=223376 RepID=A0ABR3XAT2_9PEZI